MSELKVLTGSLPELQREYLSRYRLNLFYRMKHYYIVHLTMILRMTKIRLLRLNYCYHKNLHLNHYYLNT